MKFVYNDDHVAARTDSGKEFELLEMKMPGAAKATSAILTIFDYDELNNYTDQKIVDWFYADTFLFGLGKHLSNRFGTYDFKDSILDFCREDLEYIEDSINQYLNKNKTE